MIGKVFGRLTVLKEGGRRKNGSIIWKCQCFCGTIINIRGDHLRDGNTKSCGCLHIERIKELFTKHGMSETQTYAVWQHIIQRCNNSKDANYPNYGGRGITVCKRWLKFENFFKDMGENPEGLTIERKNNELGYFKDNCCWDTYTAQRRNQRINSRNKTGINGVHFNKRDKRYCVQIGVNHKIHHIGHFTTLEQATEARQQAEQKYWGKHV